VLIIWRWWYFAGLAGVGCIAYGVVETGVAMRSGQEPMAVAFADLEQGKPLEQPYVRLGEHFALDVRVTRSGRKGSKAKTMYPLVRVDHPALQTLVANPRVLGSAMRAGVRVLGLTNGPATWSQPQRFEHVDGLVSTFEELSSDERELVTRLLPGVDTGKVRVIEIGRRPKPLFIGLGALAVGIGALWWAIRRFRGPRPKRTKPPAAASLEPLRQRQPERGYLDEIRDQQRPLR
jgi:hypothetical protein